MSNAKKTLFVLLSGLMLVIGLVMLLDIFNISAASVIIPAIGIVLMFVYFNSKEKAFLYISFFLLSVGIASFLNINNIIPGMYSAFSVVLAVSVALILVYAVCKQSILLYASEIIAFFNFAILFSTISLSVIEAVAYTMFAAGVLFVIMFAFENRKTGYTPLALAVICYIAGFLNLSYDFGFFNLIVYKCSISALFILSGILILMYALIFNKKTEKVEENTDE
jgi:hypothetical protein